MIFDYLSVIDRFRLKMTGDRTLINFISNQPRPSFETYLKELNICQYMIRPKVQREKALHIACEAGYDALVLKFLSKQSRFKDTKGLLLLDSCIASAVKCRQKSVVTILASRLDSWLLLSLKRLMPQKTTL